MGNPYAGEVTLTVNGTAQVCKLTLGALAELETNMIGDTLFGLIERFDTQGFSARDVLSVLAAGLRGGGWTGTTGDLLTAEIEGGPIAAGQAAARLLALAFAPPQDDA